MLEFVDPQWQGVPELNGCRTLDDLWGLDHRWVERPNERKGGWGAVARHEWRRTDGSVTGVFVKLHRSRMTRTLRHPLRGVPALRREFDALRMAIDLGIPTTPPVLYAEDLHGPEPRAVLVTEEIAGFQPLDALTRVWEVEGRPPPSERAPIIEAAAGVARHAHDRNLKVNALVPRHLFVRSLDDGGVDIRLIDLERLHRTRRPMYAAITDLATLARTTRRWSATDRLRFLVAYCRCSRLDGTVRQLWLRVAARLEQRLRRRQDPRAGAGPWGHR